MRLDSGTVTNATDSCHCVKLKECRELPASLNTVNWRMFLGINEGYLGSDMHISNWLLVYQVTGIPPWQTGTLIVLILPLPTESAREYFCFLGYCTSVHKFKAFFAFMELLCCRKLDD